MFLIFYRCGLAATRLCAVGVIQAAAARAANFWNENKGLIDENIEDLSAKFGDPDEELTRPISDRWNVVSGSFKFPTKSALVNYLGRTAAGNMVGAAIGGSFYDRYKSI